MRRVPLIVLAVLLIAGLLGMHALASAPMPATASMASSGHASPASPAVADQATAAPVSAMSGPHGAVHGSGGCADAMSGGGGSTCVSVPTGKDLPTLPAPSAASLPYQSLPQLRRRRRARHLAGSRCRIWSCRSNGREQPGVPPWRSSPTAAGI